MKTENFHGIEMFILSRKETKKYITENNGVFDMGFSRITRVPTYVFPDKKHLYDFSDHAFLFNSKEDLLEFKKKSLELADMEFETNNSIDLGADFVENTDSLIAKFETEYNIRFDFNQIQNLKNIDSIINKSSNNDRFRNEFKISLIAIVGKFLIHNLDKANWFISNINGRWEAVITDVDMKTYYPMNIVEKEINHYLKEDGSVHFLDHVQIELIQYKAANLLLK